MGEHIDAEVNDTSCCHGVDFFKNETLSKDDKLALLKFIAKEFDLKHPMVLNVTDASVTQNFLVEHYEQHSAKIDLLYLDANVFHDESFVLDGRLFGLLSRKGVICIESGHAAELNNANQLPDGIFESVFVTNGFSVFARVDGERPLQSMRYQVDMFYRKRSFERKRRINVATRTQAPQIAVIVLTYNHEDYIANCLRSILCQRGMFSIRIIIIDDASPDRTAQVVRSVIAENNNESIDIEFNINSQNIGVVANLATAISKAAGSDYFTFCEGDDFWTSENRIQKHLDFLSKHPACVMSFNSIEFCDSDGGSKTDYNVHKELLGSELSGNKLAEENYIGNFTACFYCGELADFIPKQIFKIYTVDWFFNLYISQFGKIGHIKEVLSAYRQHAGGEWSSRSEVNKALEILRLIGEYNKFLDYLYDESFQRYLKKIYRHIDCTYAGNEGKFGLLIVDDVFPALKSGFRYAEFSAYLRNFQDVLALVSGKTLHLVGKKSITDVVREYQRKHPDLGHKLIQYQDDFPLRLANLIYLNFLRNTYELLPAIESARVPFVFTLYPGSEFVLNDPQCDRKLKRVFDSPCFQKVIVTQQVTYDYIVLQELCPVEKIEMIFGVVMAGISSNHSTFVKSRWGFGKPRLDICFMAHKYTPHGEDKGYDVFINVAKLLRQHYDDIFFHVVGPFDCRVIDVSTLGESITFHGSLNPEEFDIFFKNIDIILSPNISNKIFPGSFDGFPTASCTEAGLRGAAIFAIDEFNSSVGRFTDGEDIVLIKYDLTDIVEKIKRYHSNPMALRTLGENGSRRIRELYSYEAQMKPRIKLLREVMSNSKIAQSVQNHPNLKSLRRYNKPYIRQTVVLFVLGSLRKYCPEPLKNIYRIWKKRYAS